MPDLGIFGLEFENDIVIIYLTAKFREKMKMPKLGIFRLEFEKNIVIFEISILEFVFLQSLVQK